MKQKTKIQQRGPTKRGNDMLNQEVFFKIQIWF